MSYAIFSLNFTFCNLLAIPPIVPNPGSQGRHEASLHSLQSSTPYGFYGLSNMSNA
uniref:Uncharacterized protein n=1 Tax=Rhizophora mucronata TaxID=61149 RepID=A0A2P2P4U9_RHIMU